MAKMPAWKQYYVGAAVVGALGLVLLLSPDVGVWPLWAIICFVISAVVGVFGWLTRRKRKPPPVPAETTASA